MNKAKSYKLCNNFKIGMKVLVKNNKKQGRKGSRFEEDWLEPHNIHNILDNCVKVSKNGKVSENKTALIHIKHYKSPSIAQKHAQLSDQILLPSPTQNASVAFIFPEFKASGEAPQEDTSPATDNAGMKQQPDVLLNQARVTALHSPACQHCR